MKKQNLLGRGIALVLCATVLGQTMSTNGVAVFAANKSEAVIQTDDTISDKNTIEENQGRGENDSTGEIKEISLECANYSSSLVELRWNVEDDFECSAFFIYRDGKKIDVLDKTDEAEYGYSDKNVEANKTYSYRIEAVNSEETKVAESAELYVEVLEDWNITGDTTLSQNKKVKNLTITKGTLNLSSYELQVEGTVTLSGEGKLNVNKGYLECNNLNVSRNYTYITMTDVNGYILVKNNMTYSSYSSSSISAGTLEIKGDFTYDSTSKGCFSCIGKHKTIFSGKKKQTIKFSDESSYFSIVELDNHSEDGVVSSGVLNAYELHTNGCKLDQGIEGGKSGWTLSDDETVDGDLILQSDELDLDGHTLRIKGDFIQPGGMVKINKGTLIVDGNYYIENKKNTDGTDKFSRGSGILKMLDSEDRVVVKGNFRMGSLWKHESVIKAGTMEVGGDFKQTTYVNNGNFASTESFKLIMNGKGAQKIDFAQNEPSASRIANLEIQNDSEDGVTIGGNHVTVTGTITDNGHYVKGYVIPGASATITDNTYHGNLYLHVSRTIGFPLVVEGTVSQDTSITYNADVTIKGGYSLSNGYGYLSGHEMHVEGNVTISSNGYYYQTNLVLQGGKLICEGNLTVNPSYSYIIMNNANDYIYVGGNCSFTSSVCSTMSAGTLELKGDFTQKGSYSNVQASGSHKVVLSGDKKQTVLFENTSCHFHNLVLENYSEEGIYAPNGLNANNITWNGCKVSDGSESVSGWKLTEDYVKDGDLYINAGEMDLNGHKLTVKGNLIQSGGQMNINGGELSVEGNYYIQQEKKEEGKEPTYGASKGELVMTNENDKVIVKKNFVMGANTGSEGKIKAGTMEVGGDFKQVTYASNSNFASTGTFKLIMNGEGAQKIDFAQNEPGASRIANLEIQNDSEDGVTIGGNHATVTGTITDNGHYIKGWVIPGASATITDNIYHGNLYLHVAKTIGFPLVVEGTVSQDTNITFNADVTIKGGYSLSNGYGYLNGHEMHVEGNVTISSNGYYYQTYLVLQGGKLICEGNLTVNNSYSHITMNNANDYIYVGGNCTISSSVSSSMSAGTIELKGDFAQTGTYSNIQASGSHKVVLSGDRKQTVLFENTSCHFHNLVLENYSEEGIYAPNGLNANNITWNGCKVSDGSESVSGWKLTEDFVKDGDLYINAGEMDLNGHKLTVKGNLIQSGGSMLINGGELSVEGNYYIQQEKKEEGKEPTYGASKGELVMTNDNDKVIVKKNFVMGANTGSEGKIKAGTMEVGGDFKQVTYASNSNFASTGTFKLIMNGDGAQKIDFAQNEPGASRIANLEIKNDSEDGVTIGGNHATVTGTITDNGHYIKGWVIPGASATITDNIYHGNLYLHVARTIGFPLVVEGTVSQDTNITFNADVTIKGGYSLSSSYAYLNGHEMHVEGNVTISSSGYYYQSYLVLQGGKMICEGNLTVNNSYSHITMNNANDYIYVGGNCTISSSVSSTMSAGTIELKGNFAQTGTYNNIQASGSHKVLLSGDRKQTVTIENISIMLNILELNNTSNDGVYFSSANIPARQVIKNETKIHINGIGVFGWKLTEDTVIEGDVYVVSDVLDLNGHTLKISGNLYIGSGKLFINGGELIVEKDLRFQSITTNADNEVTSYANSSSYFDMTNDNDIVTVGGNFVMQSTYDINGMLTKGVLEIKGNFVQNNGSNYNFRSTGSHTVVLSGAQEQTITFANPSSTFSYFNNLKIENTSSKGVVLKSNIYVNGYLDDANTKISKSSYSTFLKNIDNLKGDSFGGNIYMENAATLKRDLTVLGSFGANKNVNLNGYSLTTGSYTQSEGTLTIGGGNLNVVGSLSIGNYGYLNMTNAQDYVCVTGNFTTDSYYSHDNYLKEGTLEIRGDFKQTRTGNFTASGNHTTVLSGKTGTANRNYVQIITFAAEGSGKFNHLVLNKAKSLYLFTPAIDKICNDYVNEAKDDEAPSKVMDVTVTNKEATKVSLSWLPSTDNETVTGYEIYRGNVKVGTTSKTTFVDSGLTPSTTYIYKVCAFDEMRNVSTESDPITVTTLEDTDAPSVPSGVKVKSKTGSAITITWNASSDNVSVKGYIVYRKGEEIARLGNETLYRDADVEKDELYTYSIRAYDAAGNESQDSEEVKGSLAMPEITKVEPKNNASIGGGSTTITVYYKNSGNSVGNKVKFEYQSENDAGEKVWEQIGGVTYGQQTYNSTTLYSRCIWDYMNVKNGECKMRITLYDADGNTDTETFSYIIDTEGPIPTDDIRAKSSDGVVTVSWSESDSADCVKYKVFRAEGENSDYVLVATVNDNEYSDKNVEEGKTYFYKVSGLDNYGQEGEKSESAKVTISTDEAAPEVTGISVKNKRINKVTKVKVTGSDNLKLATLSLEYQNPKDEEWIGIDGTTKEVTNNEAVFDFDTTELSDGKYKLRAIATDAAGNKSAGHISYGGLEMDLDPYYADVVIDNTGIEKIVVNDAKAYATYVTLKWNNVSEDDFSYFVVEQLKGDKYEQVARINTTLGAHIQNLDSDTAYTFRVVGYDNLDNRGIPSDEIVLTTKEDREAPIVKSFYPTNKYYKDSIPLSLNVTDNSGVKSLRLTYSTDRKEWKDITTITLDKAEKSYTFKHSFDVYDIPEGTVYVRAFAYDEMGNESNADGEPIENNFDVDRTAPSEVMNVVAEGMSGYNSITWKKAPESDGVREFRLYRALEEVGNYTLIASGITTNIYYDTTAVAGEVYTYKVLAVDEAGNIGDFSAEAVAQSRKDDEAPVVHALTPATNSKVTGTTNIKAIVSDNSSVQNVTFEFKSADSEEDVWTEIATVAVGKSVGYPAVDWDVSNFENKKYIVRVTASDYMNNISNTFTAEYVVDTVAPTAPELSVTGIGYGAKLSWTENKEDDFDHYEVYRKLGGEEEFELITRLDDNTYEDKNLKPDRKYIYKVYAYDEVGNFASSSEVAVTPTSEDTEAPVAVVSEDMSVRQGSELLLDGTASHDNVKVVEYKWDMGNGDVVYGPIVRYRYKEMGTYKAKLTVTDAAGNSDTTPITVRVRSRISAKVDFKVINKSGSNNYIMSYSYIYIENDGVGENYRADSYGELSVVLSAGTYTVDVYKEGYMPKSYRITVANGDEQVQTLEIEKGELVTGELTTTRLTLQQIIDLGVDLQDPNNWYTYTYKMTYTVPGTPVKKTQNINLYPGTVTKVSRGDGGGINGGGYYYVSMVDVEGKKVVTVYETVSFLKKMYDVKLLVTNNAEDGYGFDIVDSTATLNLPGGLSLLKISAPQYLTNDLGTLHAQETKETHWYIRADEPGSYDLSATFNGTLMPFEAPVNTVISADEPLEVTPEEDNTFTDDGFASNPTDYVLRIVDKRGNRVKGAIVTLSCGGKQCQAITNSRGTARLEVNRGDTRTFNLSVVHDDFILYNQSYNIKTDYYTDTITLYRPGESEDDDEGEYTDRKNPYLEGYDIGMSAATFNGASIIYFTKYINRLVNKNHTLDFTFTENINKYELTLNGKTIDMGETDSDTLSISFSGGDFEEEGRLALTVYGEEKSATYKLNVYVEKRLFDKVMLKDKTVFVDLLTETYNIYTSDQDTTYEITCNILDEAKSAATSFVLVQEDEEAVTSDNGVFEVRSGHFEPFKPIYLIAFDGEEVVTKDRLYLNVIKAIDSDFELKIGTDELSYKVSSDIPILGGCEISFDLGDYELPYDIEYNSEGCKITVGNTLGEGEGACKLFTIIPGKLSMALDVSGSLYGNYESTKFEGSLELKFTITGEWEQQLPITFPVVIAIEATGEFGATGKLALDLTEESKEKISGALELAMSLGLDVFAGIGVAETVSAGIYGKATFNASMDLLPKTQGNKVSLEGDLGVRFKLFNMKTDFSILSGEYIIYDREHPELVGKGLKGMTVDEIKNHIYDMKNYYYPVPEDNEKTQEWLGESLSGTENDIQVIQDGIDSDANPVMVDAKGKTLLLFNSKDSNDDIYNESRVVYSVYDNGKFTKPEYVDASDKAQFGFDVFESDGETYIIWQEAAKRFTEDDTLDIVAKSVELKAAKWDGTKFVSLGTITDNEKCELKPQICASNGKIYAVWYENSEDDIFEQKGTDTVYCAEYADGEWSTKKLAAELQGINSMDAGKVDDSMYVAYASTGTDCMIDLSDGESAEYALDARNVQFGLFTDNKVLTWNENGTLYYADKKNEAAYVLCGSSLLKECGYSYISDNNGNYSIVFTKTVDGKAQLYVSDYDMETNQWGEPQAVTTQDYYIENVAGIYVNNRLLTVFNQTQASVTKDNVSVDSDLCFMEIGKHDKVSINEVTFDNSEVMPGGNVRLNIDLANNGLKTVSAENINITVKDENGKVKAEAKGTKSVKAGTSEIQEVIINLPFTLSVSAYTVEVTCGESTAIKSISMGYADLCVSAKVSVNHDVYEVVSTVENLGIEAASGKLVFYDKDNADRVFDEKPIRELNYGESATITYVVDDSVYNKAESASIGVRIETEEDQVTTDNDKTSVFISNSATGVPCRVVFDYADGKNDLRAVYITSNTVIKLPKTPEKEGYTFIGWFDGDEKYTQDSIVSKDIKLIAKYEKNTESETSSEVETTKPGTAGSNVETTKPGTAGSNVETAKPGTAGSNVETAKPGTAGSNVEAAKPGTAGSNVEAAKPDTAGNNAQASALSEQNAGTLKATSIKKITAKKKALAVKWKKVAGAKGYKLQYSLNKKFSKAKTVNIKKSSAVSKVIKKLKSNKKYYIRIRYYKVSGGKTYLSKWSKVKSKKTR